MRDVDFYEDPEYVYHVVADDMRHSINRLWIAAENHYLGIQKIQDVGTKLKLLVKIGNILNKYLSEDKPIPPEDMKTVMNTLIRPTLFARSGIFEEEAKTFLDLYEKIYVYGYEDLALTFSREVADIAEIVASCVLRVALLEKLSEIDDKKRNELLDKSLEVFREKYPEFVKKYYVPLLEYFEGKRKNAADVLKKLGINDADLVERVLELYKPKNVISDAKRFLRDRINTANIYEEEAKKPPVDVDKLERAVKLLEFLKSNEGKMTERGGTLVKIWKVGDLRWVVTSIETKVEDNILNVRIRVVLYKAIVTEGNERQLDYVRKHYPSLLVGNNMFISDITEEDRGMDTRLDLD